MNAHTAAYIGILKHVRTRSVPAELTTLFKSAERNTWLLRERIFRQREPLTYVMSPSRNVKAATRAKEMSALKWLSDRNLIAPISSHYASDLAKGLQRINPAAPVTKALPADRKAVEAMLASKHFTTEEKIMIELAFSSASRMDEVATLANPKMGRRIDRNALIFGKTKSNPTGAARADHFHAIVNPSPRLSKFFRMLPQDQQKVLLKANARMSKSLEAYPVPSSEVERWRRMNAIHPTRDHYTLHSFKRGAAYHLWELAAAKEIEPSDVARHLKHKSIDSSVGYAPNPVTVAKAMNRVKVNVLHIGTTRTRPASESGQSETEQVEEATSSRKTTRRKPRPKFATARKTGGRSSAVSDNHGTRSRRAGSTTETMNSPTTTSTKKRSSSAAPSSKPKPTAVETTQREPSPTWRVGIASRTRLQLSKLKL